MPTPAAQPSTQSHPRSVTLLPDPADWLAQFSPLTPQPSPSAIDSRAQLGLPTDRPIVASGHQPILFHPGILAKLIALDAYSKRTNAAPVWLVPDQDIVDPATIRIPARSDDRLRIDHLSLTNDPIPEAPACAIPPITLRNDLPDAFHSIAQWLSGYTHESSLARQFASATIAYLCDQLDLTEPTIIYASDLLATPAGSAMLDALLTDPRAAATTYNNAVAQFPTAGVRPLTITDSQIELPLWKLNATTRTPLILTTNDPHAADPATLLPRGLLMTALMRAGLSDLFIHGTGGHHYDQITELWMHTWRDQPLAPITAATATLTLDLPLPDTQDPDRAAWIAHHARHDPAMLNDPSAAEQKFRLVEQIATSTSPRERQSLFQQLHAILNTTNAAHAQELRALDQSAQQAQASRDQHAIATDRTWSFPLYPLDQLKALRDHIARRFGA